MNWFYNIKHHTISIAILFLIFYKNVATSYIPEVELAVDYFKYKNVKEVVTFLTWTDAEKVEFIKLAEDSSLLVCHIGRGIEWNSERNVTSKTKNKNFNFFAPLRLPVGKLGILYDMEYADSEFLIKLSKYRYTNTSFVWMMLNPDFDTGLNALDKLNLFVDADIVLPKISDDKPENETFDLFDVYNPGHGRGTNLVVTKLGNWTKDSGLTMVSQTFWSRRRDMQGARLRAVSVTKDRGSTNLMDYLTDRSQPYTDSLSKASYNMGLLLQDYYNFTMVLSEGKSWWNPQFWERSMVGMLNADEGDFAVTCLRFVDPRIDFMDSYFQLWEFSTSFLFLKPAHSGGVLSTELLRPFSAAGWGLVVASAGAAALVVYLAALGAPEGPEGPEGQASLGHHLFLAHGALCQQGSDVVPVRLSGRIMFLFLFLTAILLNNFYTSCVVSFLLEDKASPINSIRELADSRLKLGLENLPYNQVVIENPENEEIKYLNEKVRKSGKQIHDLLIPLSEGVSQVQRGTMALHTERASLYSVIATTFLPEQICQIQEIEVLPRNKLSTVIQKNSPFIKIFKIRSLWAHETGLLSRADGIYRASRPRCQAGGVVGAVTAGQLTSLLLFLLLGGVTAVLILLLECAAAQRGSGSPAFH